MDGVGGFPNIRQFLLKAVKKRVITSDRSVGCLLSGGLDSSIVASIAQHYYPGILETFSIGMPDSEDIKYARKVADFLGTNHHEIILSEEDFLNAIPQVIHDIESYDTTTVRASVGNWLISKYISEKTDCKVILNGDGADELMGGYLYLQKAPNDTEFDQECKRLLKDIHLFDGLRSDRCISAHGLEARMPFLDKEFVDYYLSIPKDIRFQHCDKSLVRNTFYGYLPNEVLYRRKEAFSDGVSSLNNSWYQIIQKKCNEVDYYESLFQLSYPNLEHVIPYKWMPKYVDATDASARTLEMY